MRFTEITGGIIIAFLVSRFLFPLQAKSYLLQNIYDNLLRLQKCFSAVLSNVEFVKTQEMQDVIIDSFVNQRKLIKEAAREVLITPFDNKTFSEIVMCEREILRGIDFLHYALQLSDTGKNFLTNTILLDSFAKQINDYFYTVINALHERKIDVHEQVDLQQMEQVSDDLLKHTELTASDVQHLSLLVFCARTIAVRLHELSYCIARILGEPDKQA